MSGRPVSGSGKAISGSMARAVFLDWDAIGPSAFGDGKAEKSLSIELSMELQGRRITFIGGGSGQRLRRGLLGRISARKLVNSSTIIFFMPSMVFSSSTLKSKI